MSTTTDQVLPFIDKVLIFLDHLGRLSTFIVIVATLVGIYMCLRGFVPVLIRLGNGLWKRKLAIFAKGDALISLQNLLHDSKLFNKVNIYCIPSESDFATAEKASLFLVYWPDFKDSLPDILNRKADNTALIIYAPQEFGFIPPETMTLLGKHRNVIVNNFRGRLMNDLVISMITTGYEKK